MPLEGPAAIERRAVVPLVGFLGLDRFILLEQLLEPADVLHDGCADQHHGLILVEGRRGDDPIVDVLEPAVVAQRDVIAVLGPELLTEPLGDRIEGMKEGVQLRVEVRLDPALAEQPTKPDHFRISPGNLGIEHVEQLSPLFEQPAAALGAFFHAADDHRRVIIGRGIRIPRPDRRLIEEFGAELVHLPDLAVAGFLGIEDRGLADSMREARRADPLGAIDIGREPHLRSTRSASIGVRGCMAAMFCWIRSSSSAASSWGSTGMIVRAFMPCL